ncbi:hypothetical protein K2Z83_15595 [Oscillochloris sp. ZM17-4]|uniref:hypothetical protein n=1 Tax=Oscillochloris sp. ZM17-4 TaxID=2866714 RepID=UPI001C735091|nr:hypothetical protein [Oscillochloris sp. ZM17-4]MBX0329101.1 hypothetical protein [Oscillochloris sp. ZM17-4]
MKPKKKLRLLERVLARHTNARFVRYACRVPIRIRNDERPAFAEGLRFGAFGVVEDGDGDGYRIHHVPTGALCFYATDLWEAIAICGALHMVPVDWPTITLEDAQRLRNNEGYMSGVRQMHQVCSALRRAAQETEVAGMSSGACTSPTEIVQNVHNAGRSNAVH